MKIKELKENEPLEVIEVTNHMEVPPVPGRAIGRSYKKEILEEKKIQMRIFTDGEIEKQTKETSQNINEFYIGKSKYQYDVDTLKTKNIYFKNHSYVIVYIITNEFRVGGKIMGWFDVIDKVSVYLKNPKDKKALKSAKQVIREISYRNASVNYSSIPSMLVCKDRESDFETKKITKDVYSFKKVR